MTDAHSTRSAPQGKPIKPDDCPLFPHASGRWAKKIRGRLVYFGKWDDLPAALKKYEAEKDDLYAGRNPREGGRPSVFSIGDLCNGFLKSRFIQKQSGDLSHRAYVDYEITTDIIVDHFGKWRAVEDVQPEEFMKLRAKLMERYGPDRLSNTVSRVRTVFTWAFNNQKIPQPVCFGDQFKRASQKLVRKDRHAAGQKLFTAEEVHRLLDAAGLQLKAMILLGINCGYGNHDCGTLPLSAIDFDKAMVTYPRPKTGILRRCPLWPETVEAIRAALAERPEPKDAAHAGLVFITKYGQPWAKEEDIDSPVTKETAKLLKELHINGRRRLGFYCLRHTHRTVSDGAKDTRAADFIMGHSDGHMRHHYLEAIDDERLKAVTDHVHAWLFGKAVEA